jgi:formylglycine-generating enzyme required for sulfatase activity
MTPDSMDFVSVPSGLFAMGSDDDLADAQEYEKPLHGVILSRPFRLSKYPVTQSIFESVMGYNPSQFKGGLRPVENVTWNEAQTFIQKLGASAGENFRLPTEAEWEYAARAGTESPYYFGDDESSLGAYAWYSVTSGGRTQNVGMKIPNTWGLYDMLGNVWEWVSNWYDDYDERQATNPAGPPAGSNKVIRGGAWGSTARLCRCAVRSVKNPLERSPLIGFRLAMDGEGAPPEDDDEL